MPGHSERDGVRRYARRRVAALGAEVVGGLSEVKPALMSWAARCTSALIAWWALTGGP